MIPLVVASERGRAQTATVARLPRGSRTATLYVRGEHNALESAAKDGDSPVCEAPIGIAVS